MTPQSLTVSGRTISHYEVLEKLGEGGMGVVYKARDTRLDRLVAIKFLSPRLADAPRARERLLREARIISTLSHPHIAVIHDVDEWEGGAFLVFEHLPGGNLHTRAPHTLAQALQYALQLAEALAAAHRHRVVHRDVKPANVLFAEDDTLKLADFGLARQAADVHLTGAGAALGTPAYMAPELFRGGAADERSDVYSLGIVIHELIAGKLPEAGHALAVPAPLRQVLERALEADPHRRYPSAAGLASDLRGAIARLEFATRATTVSLPLPPPKRAVGALLLAVALAALLVNHAPIVPPNAAAPGQLAVLPFTTSDSAPTWRIVCDGLTDTISAALARFENSAGPIRVVPAAAVRRQAVASSADARRLLGARFVVTGNLLPETGGVRLSLSVLDTRTERSLGAETASFAPAQLPFLQEWAVARIGRALQISGTRIDRAVPEPDRTREPSAYEFYLQGRGYLSHYDVPEDLGNAVAAFHKALQRDPRYALAHAGMAEALWRTWRHTKDSQWLEQASESAVRARQLNDRLAPVHVILGRIENSRGRNQEAIRAFRRALELEPLNPDVHSALAAAWQSMGKAAEAEAAWRRVIELRPGEWLGYNNLGVFYSEQRRFAEAEQAFQQMIALVPENVIGFQNLGGLYLMMSRYTEACGALERAVALKPTATGYSNLATAYYYEGRYPQAAAVLEKAVEQRPADFVIWGNLGDARRLTPAQQGRARQAWNSAAGLARAQLAINPGDAQVRSSLAVFEAHMGNRAAALADIARSRRILASNARVLSKAARVYELCGRRREALEALKLALQTGESPETIRREPEFSALRRDPACAQSLPKEVCNERHSGNG